MFDDWEESVTLVFRLIVGAFVLVGLCCLAGWVVAFVR